LNLDDVEEGDLIRVDDESEEDEKAYSVVAHWNWAMKNYYIYYLVLFSILGFIVYYFKTVCV
ncbi:hypothetical protein ACFFUW_12315, partial [Kurthia sibirica]